MEAQERAMKTETFIGTLAEVQRKATDWKAAHPGFRLIHEYAPFAVGERVDLVAEPIWTLTIRYEDTESN